jgi:signal transduction histidine kinase/ActR/RegA family two-component response regulator
MDEGSALSAEVGEVFVQTLLDAFPGPACLIDGQGVILAVNQVWRSFAADNGADPAKTGERVNYLEVCEQALGKGPGPAAAFAAGLREVLGGSRPHLELEYFCHSPQERRWFAVTVTRFSLAGRPCLLVFHHDISDRRRHAEAVQVDLAIQQVRNEVLQMRVQEDWARVVSALHQSLQTLVSFAGCGVIMVSLKRKAFYAYAVGPEGVSRGEVCDFLPQSLEQVVRAQVPVYRRNRREMAEWGDNLSERHSVIDVPFAGGTLALNSEQENGFSLRDIHVLERFALVLSEAHRRLQALQRQEAVSRVREAVWSMEKTEDIHRMMNIVREQLVTNNFAFDDVGVAVVETPAQPLEIRHFTYGTEGKTVKGVSWSVGLGNGLYPVLLFWRSGKVVYRRDLQAEDLYGEGPGMLPRIRSVVDVPFSHGTLAVNSQVPDAFSADDIQLLQEVAAALSEGFKRLEDLQQLEVRAQALEREVAQRQAHLALQRVRNEVLLMEGEGDWHKVVDCFYRELRTLVEFHMCSIQFVDLQKDLYTAFNSKLSAAEFWPKGPDVPRVPSLRQVMEQGRPLYRRNRLEIEQFKDAIAIDVKCVVEVPFLGGTIAMNSTEEDAFSEGDIQMLEQFAGVMNEAYRRLEDLKKLGQAEARLRQAQKMEAVGQLTAGIAHNFNNMLQSILLNLELTAAIAPARLQAGLNEATEEGLRAAEMIRQLMIFGRQRPAGRYGCFDLGQVVQNTVEICRKTFDRKIELRIAVAEGLPLALGDATQVQQVLLNLCLNARDALAEVERAHPYIEVRAGVSAEGGEGERRLRVEVQDNGCGMDAPTRERIFEPFFTTKEVGKGTGLGLATVYAIVRDHQGQIECQSALGKGSTFRLLLPLGAQEPEAESWLQDTIPQGRETLLIIDDDRGPRQAMARMLREQGYTVLEAVDGGEGLEVFQRDKEGLGLVILDLSMPGLSGGQVLARLKAQAPGLPVVLCSGYALPAGQFEGAAAILQKPVRAAELGQAVRQALDRLSGAVPD